MIEQFNRILRAHGGNRVKLLEVNDWIQTATANEPAVVVVRLGGSFGIHCYVIVMMIAALFVQCDGCYQGLPDVDAWDEERDARKYSGPYPVVAHPPCQRYGHLGVANYARWGGEHNRPRNDGGCFAAALAAVNCWGGVLEHPAFSDAWPTYNLERPRGGWSASGIGWVCEVWQSAYGHKARKRTWLYYVGECEPPELNWDRPAGTHQVGFQDQRGKGRNKPTLSTREANATPVLFRDELLRLARHSVQREMQCT